MIAPGATVGQALRAATARLDAAGKEKARLDAEVLLARTLGADRVALITRRDDPLADDVAARFATLIERRIAGEPVAYLLGEKEFFSLPFMVDRRVLIPRPETEELVEEALRLVGRLIEDGAALRVVDVGTGSGAIVVALAHEARRRGIALAAAAIDLSPDALAVADANAARLLGASRPALMRGDLLGAIAATSVDLVVSNPPYLSDDDLASISTEVAAEPVAALRGGGKDGAQILRELLTDATRVLKPGGFLLSEIGSAQGDDVGAFARGLGFEEVRVLPDLSGLDRMLAARWRSEAPRSS